MEEIVSLDKDYILPFYSRFDLGFYRGKGAYLYGYDGKRYLDLTSGISVLNFGHSHPAITREIKRQASKLVTTSNLFYSEERVKLAQKLISITFDGGVFFSNSGAEANEAAIKISRFFGKTVSKSKYKILSLTGSFHGRTLATITVTGQKKYQKKLEPLPEGFEYVEYNDIQDLENKVNDDICAIFLEAIQGEGGIRLLSSEFVERIKELKKKYNFLVVFDEVQTGVGRTGKYFGYMHFDIEPDIITLAKAIGGGLPVGITVLKREYFNVCEPGMHASTMGGNQLASAVALKVLELLSRETLEHVNRMGNLIFSQLGELRKKYSFIKEIRGKGLMIGVEFDESIKVMDVIKKLIGKNILTLKAGENVLRLLPPFVITTKEVDMFIDALGETLKSIVS